MGDKSSAKKKGLKQEKSGAAGPSDRIQEDLSNLITVVNNIETMHGETHAVLQEMASLTKELNTKIESKFEQFRSQPVRTKHFNAEEKARTRQALSQFELSDEEDHVCLEGIRLGDGKYNQIWAFQQNVRKLMRMVLARQIIHSIKKERQAV